MRKRSVYAALLALMMVAEPTDAATFTFAGFTFDQDDTPDTLGLIGNGAILDGAQFSAGTVTRITRSVGFNAVSGNATSGFVGKTDFDPSLTLGRQGNAQHSLTQSDGTSCVFGCAINMPNGNNGSSTRHGIEVSWSGGLALTNEAGDDFVIYESASTPTGDEGFMVRLGLTAGGFTDWRFETSNSFELYSDSSTGGAGATATAFDLSDFGVSEGGFVSAIQIANLTANDTIGADGEVLFDGSGGSHGFASGSLDPDPVYIGALNTVGEPGSSDVDPVPLPATLPLFGAALAGLGIAAWRKRTAG